MRLAQITQIKVTATPAKEEHCFLSHVMEITLDGMEVHTLKYDHTSGTKIMIRIMVIRVWC